MYLCKYCNECMYVCNECMCERFFVSLSFFLFLCMYVCVWVCTYVCVVMSACACNECLCVWFFILLLHLMYLFEILSKCKWNNTSIKLICTLCYCYKWKHSPCTSWLTIDKKYCWLHRQQTLQRRHGASTYICAFLVRIELEISPIPVCFTAKQSFFPSADPQLQMPQREQLQHTV